MEVDSGTAGVGIVGEEEGTVRGCEGGEGGGSEEKRDVLVVGGVRACVFGGGGGGVPIAK